jgi:hypothetical protein
LPNNLNSYEQAGNRPEIEEPVKDEKKDYLIIVNAREKQWLEKSISFHQVVVLAFGVYQQDLSTAYTVVYKGGEEKKEGSLVAGSSVKVKDKMIFNVTATNKS